MRQIKATKSYEFSVVPYADAIVEPYTMVIEPYNTLIAHAAVFDRRVDAFIAYITEESQLLLLLLFSMSSVGVCKRHITCVCFDDFDA